MSRGKNGFTKPLKHVFAMTPPDQPEENDGRTSARKKTLRTGTIIFNHRMTTTECAVFDLSNTGARLRPLDFSNIPDQFELRVLFGDTYQCHVIHKTRDQIGVRFV